MPLYKNLSIIDGLVFPLYIFMYLDFRSSTVVITACLRKGYGEERVFQGVSIILTKAMKQKGKVFTGSLVYVYL